MPPEADSDSTTSPTGSESTDVEVKTPRFHFRRYLVHRALFDEIDTKPAAAEGETRPSRVNVELAINASVNVSNEAAGAAVFLNVHVTPDPKWQPYRVEVTVSGVFVGENTTRQQFDQFCRLNAPVILFPYIRQIVHALTAEAQYGSVIMDPVNMQEMLSGSKWRESAKPAPEVEPSGPIGS